MIVFNSRFGESLLNQTAPLLLKMTSIIFFLTPLRSFFEMMLIQFAIAYGLAFAQRRFSSQPNGLKSNAFIKFMFVGDDEVNEPTKPVLLVLQPPPPTTPPTRRAKFISIAISFVGLQVSFLTWGYVQERIMTFAYNDGIIEPERFRGSNTLVLSNRMFAIMFAFIMTRRGAAAATTAKRRTPPFVAYSFAAVANTISSFCGYQSLVFMSFPLSTVCKTLKIIPTMLMGTIVQKKSYSKSEYASAMTITVGAAIFAVEFGAGGFDTLLKSSKIDLTLAIPGAVMMTCYLAVDAFTSNWQSHLFKVYHLTAYECMLGINLFSLVLGVFNALQANEFSTSFSFFTRHPEALMDLTLLALSSAVGQIFIYYTIETHGALTFTLIQLTRQLLAIALSAWSFGHSVSVTAWIGVCLTFSGMLFLNLAGNNSNSKTSKSGNGGVKKKKGN